MKRTIELYGRLRDAGLGPKIQVECPNRATARQVLDAVKASFGGQSSALTGCVLANADDVLASGERVPKSGRLAVLPPVCGG